MTKIFIYASLTVGLACLALDWIMAGYWVVGLLGLGLVPVSLFLVKRKFQPITGLVLTFSVLAAAIGLWMGLGLSLALVSVVSVLAAWDLEGFSQRLAFASEEDDPQRIERRHLMQVNLVLLLGMGIDLVSQSIHYAFGFEWALTLAILAFYGIGALINGMKTDEV
jgi:hypothetical protein